MIDAVNYTELLPLLPTITQFVNFFFFSFEIWISLENNFWQDLAKVFFLFYLRYVYAYITFNPKLKMLRVYCFERGIAFKSTKPCNNGYAISIIISSVHDIFFFFILTSKRSCRELSLLYGFISREIKVNHPSRIT